jgi:eukaryotic-like serine/threonine-protein kinase
MHTDERGVVAALAGRYDIRREIGRGGMAVVYLAEDVRHHRLVAVKVLHRGLPPSGARRLLGEVEIAAQLVHPHIVPLHDSGRIGDLVYFVMPYLEGETLRECLDREGVLPVEDALTILRELASALDYAHHHGVIHRDVKPSNVILCEGGAMLADFGIAVALEESAEARSDPAQPAGTPEYVSPEQAAGSARIDPRSDLYSLACTLYEMLAGEPPFTASSAQAIVARHLGAPPPNVRLLRPSLPPEAAQALRRALAKQPADRFQTAGEFAEAVQRSIGNGGAVEFGAPWWPREPRHERLPLRALAPLALAALAGILLPALVWLRGVERTVLEGAPVPVPVPRQVTFEGDVRHAYGSPDGLLLAYEIVRDGVYSLVVAEADGGSPVEVYRSEGFACCPSWSPDGASILVRSGARGNGRGLVIPRLGGDPRQLPTDVVTAWSPDGERIVGWWPAADTLRLVDVATGEPRDLLPLGIPHDWVNGVHWSPDGRRLAVATSEITRAGLRAALWTMPVDGGQPTLILRDSVYVISPHWAGAGDAIYYLRDFEDVWKVRVDEDGVGGEPVRLVAGLSPHVYNSAIPAFTVSRDGARLHYARWTGPANLLAVALDPSSNSDARHRWLTSGTAVRREARISPNARSVAFLQRDAHSWHLRVTDLDGGTRRLTHFDEAVVSPAWSPDGRRIAFGATGTNGSSVWTVSVEGGAATRLGGPGYGGEEVVWLATGRILYQRSGDSAYGLLAPDSGEVGRIRAPDGLWIYGPRGAADGRRVAFRGTGRDAGLWIVDLADESWTRISERALGPVGWSPANDTVYAIPTEGRRGGISGELFAIPVEGGSERLVESLPDGIVVNPWDASLHPRKGLFVGAVLDASVDVWMIEEFDRFR